MITAKQTVTLHNQLHNIKDDDVKNICRNIMLSIGGGFRYCYTSPLTDGIKKKFEDAGYKIGSCDGQATISW